MAKKSQAILAVRAGQALARNPHFRRLATDLDLHRHLVGTVSAATKAYHEGHKHGVKAVTDRKTQIHVVDAVNRARATHAHWQETSGQKPSKKPPKPDR